MNNDGCGGDHLFSMGKEERGESLIHKNLSNTTMCSSKNPSNKIKE
jgi:hypothetical protein